MMSGWPIVQGKGKLLITLELSPMEMTLQRRIWWKNVWLPFSQPLGKQSGMSFPVNQLLLLSLNLHRITQSSTLQLLTGASTDTGNSTSPQQHEPGVARPVGLGVDPKIKAIIFANKFVKFASLLPKSPSNADEKFKSIEKDGQLLFIKSADAGQIKNITTWLQAFHVFVAIYCSNHPSEVGDLMTYAQIIQGIAKTCGDDAALEYDEKIRQWRQYAPDMCPWHQKNVELFQDALAKGIDNKQKIR